MILPRLRGKRVCAGDVRGGAGDVRDGAGDVRGGQSRFRRTLPEFGTKYYTPELTKVKFHWKDPVNVHWIFPIKIIRKVNILWTMPLKRENPLENATDNPLENATGNPR